MSNLNTTPDGAFPNFGAGQTPSPWFTVANQFLPRNLHDVIRWARYITIQSPVTSEVIRKLATYPITEFLVDSKDASVKEKYKEVFRSFKLKQSLQDIGFDYYTIGNVFLSVYFPIHRTLTCPTCRTDYNAKTAEFIEFKNYQFLGKCPAPQCSYKGPFLRKDTKSVNIKDMNLIKWDPNNIAVNFNPITGESEYYYRIPGDIKRKVQLGDRMFAASIPWGFIDAIRNNQDFKFDPSNIFHLRNLSSGGLVEGISVPPLITLFNLVFYQATLRKANESIATEHMNPMRVVFPQPQTANSDPVVSISMKNFVDRMEDAIKKQKRDKNHFLIAPVPVGYQAIGGDGKNLLVAQEIEQAEQSILLSLGVSKELLSGTSNWTSSTVGLRMMENTMFSYMSQITELTNWVMVKVAAYLNIEIVDVKFEPFKLMDDEFMKQNLQILMQAGDISTSTFMESMGLDHAEELKQRKEDLVDKAKNEVETKFEVEQAQFMASKEVVDKMEDSSDYQRCLGQAQQIAEQLLSADPISQMSMLNRLKVNDYPVYMLTQKLLDEYQEKATAAQSQEMGADGGEGGDAGAGGGGEPGAGEEENAGVAPAEDRAKDGGVAKHMPAKPGAKAAPAKKDDKAGAKSSGPKSMDKGAKPAATKK